MQNEVRLIFIDGYLEGEYLWAVDRHLKAFSRLNLSTGKVNFLEKIPCFQPRTFVPIDGELFLVARRDGDVLHFRPESEEYIKYPYEGRDNNTGILSAEPVLFDDTIWIVPKALSKKMLLFNTKEKTHRAHPEWNRKVKELCGEMPNPIIASVCADENIMWLAIAHTNLLIAYDMITDNAKKYELSDEYELDAMGIFKGLHYITLSNKNALLILNVKEKKEKLVNLEEMCGNCQDAYSRVIADRRGIFLLPKKADYIVSYDRQDNGIKTILIPEELLKKYSTNGSKMYGYQWYGNRLLLLPWGLGAMVEVDYKTRCIIKWAEVTVNETEYDAAYARMLRQQQEVRETDIKDLKLYIKALDVGDIELETSDIGKNIHGTMQKFIEEK